MEEMLTEFIFAPETGPVTSTVNVQVAEAARVAPERVMEVDAAVAVMVPPPHVPLRPFGVATAKPPGRLSVIVTPVAIVVGSGFVTTKVRLIIPFTGIVALPNDFVMVGGFATVMLAIDVLPVPAFPEVTVTELVCMPEATPVTLTEIVQVALAAKVKFARLTVPERATAVTVPEPQGLLAPLGLATWMLAGRESVKAMPVILFPEFGLVSLNDSVVVPPVLIVDAAKDFNMAGGARTTRVAIDVVEVPPSLEVAVTLFV